MHQADPFQQIVNQFYDPLFKFALSLTRAECEAQDLTQQTFYIWATKGHQLRDLSKVKSWLFTTLYRAFLESRKRNQRFQHQPLEEVSEELPVLLPTLSELDSSHVLATLSRLDSVYQPAVALFYLEDCSYKEIAEILAVPIGTVKSRIARGIQKLRELLEPSDPAPVSAPAPSQDEKGPGDPLTLQEELPRNLASQACMELALKT